MVGCRFGYYGGDPAAFTKGGQVSTWEKPACRSLTFTKHMMVYSAMSTPREGSLHGWAGAFSDLE